MNIKKTTIAINKLQTDPHNPRTLNKEKFKTLKSSLEQFPEMLSVRPLVVANGYVVGGNMRLRALKELGHKEVEVIDVSDWTQAQRDEFMIKDNLNYGDWDWDILANEWAAGDLNNWGLDVWPDDLFTEEPGLTDKDSIPDKAGIELNTKPGDIWVLGKHRIMCGDCTNPQNLAKLFGDKKANLIHADPPYGMGKESDGVQNDNLYREKLDAFQMQWWKTCRPYTIDKGSAYIWGNAPDLWRLWYKGGLQDFEYYELRNEIVWDKKAIPGMKSELMTQYPEASERCLYFQFGEQFIGNINSYDFPEEWRPLLTYQQQEAKKANLDKEKLKEITGTQMWSHWFSESQFSIISKDNYAKLAKACPGSFLRPHKELKEEWQRVGVELFRKRNAELRCYFDNAHDIMRDVLDCNRVTGEERYDHATPKPVELMERVAKSSCPVGGIILEPFLGSGSTLMGAETTGRICYGLELSPEYIDTTVKRWEKYTGKKAVKA